MKRTRSIAMLVLAILCGFLLAPQPASHAAQGDVLWNRLLDPAYGNVPQVEAHGDNTVTAFTCGTSQATYRADVLSPQNELVSTMSSAAPYSIQPCTGSSKFAVAGVDGTLFYRGSVVASGTSHDSINTVKNGVVLNKLEFSTSCSARPWGSIGDMKLGSDGHLYALITWEGACSLPDKLVKISSLTGAEIFTKSLSSRASTYAQKMFQVYDNGLIILDSNVNSGGEDLLLYYDYSGNKDETLSCSIQNPSDSCGIGYISNEQPNTLLVDAVGTVFIEMYRYVNQTCTYARRTIQRDLTGLYTQTVRPSGCQKSLNVIGPNQRLMYYDFDTKSFTVTSPSGTVYYQGSGWSRPGYTVTSVRPVTLLDNEGRLVFARVAKPSGSTDQFAFVDRLNTDGTWTNLFSSEQFGNPNAVDTITFQKTTGDVRNVAFAKDALYVTMCSTACNAGQESSRLLKVDSPGMNVDYPRSAIFAEYYADHGEPLDYVALGDSYSSGEGVSPFINGTDVNGVNKCHRSTSAYSMLLDKDSGLDLNLQSFRACSGAVTEHVSIQGQYGESAQSTSLNTATDLVTLTIGGNDVSFGPSVTQCVLEWTNIPSVADCDSALSATESQISTVDIGITNVLDEIDSKIGANTKVLVLGYPKILPEVMQGSHVALCSGWNYTTAQIQKIWDLTDSLNTQIESTVLARSDTRFEYVDPQYLFGGHTACDADRYFHDVSVWNNQEYTYHPNSDGQAALADAIADALTS